MNVPTNIQKPIVADIITVMERIAPPALAEAWDNCGLQVGSPQWPVNKIWVALDPLFSVVEAAAAQSVDMVITHHPLIFKPLRSIDVETDIGRIINNALITQTAVYAAHTNLDSTVNGINDILAQRIGLQDTVPLQPISGAYSTDAESIETCIGLGRVGRLASAVSAAQLAQDVKSALSLDLVRVAGDLQTVVRNVAVCSGGGGSLLEAFFKTDAQVYISGDLRYHDARAAEAAGRVLIDVGHFPSEHIVVNSLAVQLQKEMAGARWNVAVEPCRLEHDPFTMR
jgi:dinuclear metal center YbgI/SA1388 family protein